MPYLAVGACLSLTGGGLPAALSGTVPQARGGLLAGLLMAAYMIGLNAADLITRRCRRWLLKAASDVMQSRRHEFRDDGLTVRQGPGYGVWPWSMFIKAETWDGLLLLRTTLIRALPIPIRTFASSDEAAAALAFARTVIVDPFAPTAHPGRHA